MVYLLAALVLAACGAVGWILDRNRSAATAVVHAALVLSGIIALLIVTGSGRQVVAAALAGLVLGGLVSMLGVRRPRGQVRAQV